MNPAKSFTGRFIRARCLERDPDLTQSSVWEVLLDPEEDLPMQYIRMEIPRRVEWLLRRISPQALVRLDFPSRKSTTATTLVFLDNLTREED